MSAMVLTDELVVSYERTSVHKQVVDGTKALILDARGNPTWRYHVQPFAHAFSTSAINGEQLDRACGWSSGYHLRILGLQPDTTTHRSRDGKTKNYRTVRKSICYRNAVLLCRALDLDLTEIGV